jgi:hypothetical protein
MNRADELLLRLYPRDYRAMFATEMSSAFREASAVQRGQGWRAYARFATAELTGVTMGAGVEWIAKLTTDRSVRGRSLPDRLLMRPPGVSWDAHYAGAFLNVPEEVSKAQQSTELLVQRMVHAISHHDFQGARRYSDQERQARENLRMLRQKYQIHDQPE